MKGRDLGWLVESEKVSQIGWARVVEGFIGEEKNFEENAVISEKAVQLSEDRCCMVTLLGFSDQSLLLHSALAGVMM